MYGQNVHLDLSKRSGKTTLFVCNSSKYELGDEVKCLSVSWRGAGGGLGNIASENYPQSAELKNPMFMTLLCLYVKVHGAYLCPQVHQQYTHTYL